LAWAFCVLAAVESALVVEDDDFELEPQPAQTMTAKQVHARPSQRAVDLNTVGFSFTRELLLLVELAADDGARFQGRALRPHVASANTTLSGEQ
jgi:hypothetical protein